MEIKTDKIEKALKLENTPMVFAHSFNRILYYLPLTENLDISCLPEVWDMKVNEGLVNIPPPLPDKKDQKKLLDGYKIIMYRYLLRDCIESFALALDDLYAVLQVRQKGGIKNLKEEDRKKAKSFAQMGIYRKKDGKLQRLKKDFGLELPEDNRKALSGLKDIRDCLSHNNGLIMPHHGQKTGQRYERKFSWFTNKVYALGKTTGKKYDPTSSILPKEEVSLKIELIPNEKIFKTNEYITFSPGEVFDISYSLKLSIMKLVENALKI